MAPTGIDPVTFRFSVESYGTFVLAIGMNVRVECAYVSITKHLLAGIRIHHPDTPNEGTFRMENAAIGLRLRAYREASGESQKELAQTMKSTGFTWSQATVWNVETGERPIRANELFVLAGRYGFSLDEFADNDPADAAVTMTRLLAKFREIRDLTEQAFETPSAR